MIKEYEEQIYNIAPILYKQKDLDETIICMCWGIDCPDTWFNIILELSKKLEDINNKLKNYNCEIQASQVKEKYGFLHFYYDLIMNKQLLETEQKDIDELLKIVNNEILIAEQKTMKICAKCGNPATTCTTGYILYLCEKCKNEKN